MKKTTPRLTGLLGAGLLALSISSHAFSAESWTGATDNLWNVNTNWSGNAVPNNEVVTIDSATNNPVVLNTAAVHSIKSLTVGNTADVSLTLNVAGSLNVTNTGSSVTIGKSSAGTLTLDGAATSLTLDGGNGVLQLGQNTGSTGTLNLGNGGVAGTLNAARINGGDGTAVVNFNNATDYTLAARITGSTKVNVTGAAVTTLTSGNNNYTGTTTISDGTLQGGGTRVLSANSEHVVDATLDLNGFDQDIGALSGAATGLVTNSGTSDVLLRTGDGGFSLFNGAITDGATNKVALTIRGSEVQILGGSGLNTYSGDTTITNGSHLLGFDTNTFSANSAHVVNGTLEAGGFNQEIGSLSGNASGLVSNNGATPAVITTGGLNTDTTYDGKIQDGTGVIGITKVGTGIQTFTNGGNTYSGTTTVSDGTLQGGGTRVFSANSDHVVNATLDLGGFDQDIGSLAGTGLVTNSGATESVLRMGQGGSTDFSGAIVDGTGGTALVIRNASLQELSGSGLNTYSGDTRIAGDSGLTAGAVNAFSANSAHIVNGFMSLGGFDQEIGSLSGQADSGIANIGLAAATLTTGRLNTDTVYNGVITDIVDPLSFTKVGTGVQVLGGVNSYSGLTTINDGKLIFTNDTSKLGGNIVDNAALVFRQDMDSSFHGTITGPGTVTKGGEGALDLTGNSNVGATTVNLGTLLIDGIYQSTQVRVAINGTLGGNGTIVSNVTNNGTLAPGHSPGTLTIQGNYTQTSTGVFQLQIASQSVYDRLIVSGNAALAGELQASGYGGFNPKAGQKYAFLQAGSFTGTFDSVVFPDLEGLRGRFLILNGLGTLVIAPGSYEAMALTQNQRNVARALDSFIPATQGDRMVVSTALDSLTPSEYPAAFNAIGPSFYETLTNITIEQTTAQNQMLAQRMSAVRLGAAGFSVVGLNQAALKYDRDGKGVMDAKSSKDIISPTTETKWAAWVQGNGIFARAQTISDVPSYHYESGGVMVGADYRWNEHFSTGLYTGYQGVYSRYGNGGLTTINSALFGLYATYAQDGFYADAIVGGAYNGYHVDRPIQFGSVNRTASSDPNGGQFNAYVDAGYDWKVGNFTFGPLLSGQYVYAGTDSFTESNAQSLDLAVQDQNANSIRTNVGGRIAYTWNLTDKITIIPEGRMFWQHEYLNGARNIESSLDGGSGPAFGFQTSAPGRDSVFAGAGVSANFGDRWTTTLYYNADFGRQDFVSHMISGGVTWKF